MSETAHETDAPSQAVAVRPAREIRVVENSRAVWATADFEHMGRVASVMTDSNLLPESFRGKKDGDNLIPFERGQIVASALVLCTIAREMDANPFLLMQCASLISGRIMLEGKVIAAAIEHRTGIRLSYEFGLWDTDHFEEVEDPSALNGAGERLAIRVSGKFADEDEPRTVAGSVGQWKTTRNGSPWSKVADWPRQLRYRGAREWGRAHAPGVTLGIFGDGDDFEDDPVMEAKAPRTKKNLQAALQTSAAGANGAGAADTGFDRNHVATETGERVERDDPVHQPLAEEIECDHEFEKIGDDDQVCKHCGALPEDVADKASGNSAGGDQGPAALDGETHDLEADAAFLSDLSEEEPGVVLSRLKAAEKAWETLAENPQPEPGETYLLAGDAFTGKDKRRVTYKDGVAFSSVGPKGAEKLKVYAIHAEVPQQVDEDDDARPISEEAATGKDGVQSAASEPDTSASAGGASEASPGPEASSTAPSDDPIAEMVAAKFGAMGTWNEIKAEWATMCKSTDWVGASAQDQDHIRRAAWPLLAALRVDQSQDITAFGIWMPTQKGRDGADAIRGTFDVLKRAEVWGKLTPAQAETLEKRVAATVASLTGAAG